jgi:hypothetical protein
MMDIDDGYILWTGIWKGESPYFATWCVDDAYHSVLAFVSALGNSKGVFCLPSLGADTTLMFIQFS